VQVIIVDIGPFLVLLSLSVVAAVFFFAINAPFSNAFAFDTDKGLLWPLQTGVLMMLGSFDTHDFGNESISISMLCLFLFLGVFVMLNLVIAIMADSYEKVKESEAVHALHERAKMIVDMELQHPVTTPTVF
jgi:hypothetical protein